MDPAVVLEAVPEMTFDAGFVPRSDDFLPFGSPLGKVYWLVAAQDEPEKMSGGDDGLPAPSTALGSVEAAT